MTCLISKNILVPTRTTRGTAAEQVNVSRDRKPGSSRYWYARRKCRWRTPGSLRRILKDVERDYSGSAGCLFSDDKGKNLDSGDRLATRPVPQSDKHARAFRTNLLRKRRTYTKYFDASLSDVDLALRRVQVRRSMELSIQDREIAVAGDSRNPSYSVSAPVRWSLTIVGKTSLKECGRKEKRILKKYAATVRENLLGRVDKENKRVARSALRTKRKAWREKKRLDRESLNEVLAEQSARAKRYGRLFAPPPSISGQSNVGRGVAGGRVFSETLSQTAANRYKGKGIKEWKRPDKLW